MSLKLRYGDVGVKGAHKKWYALPLRGHGGRVTLKH